MSLRSTNKRRLNLLLSIMVFLISDPIRALASTTEYPYKLCRDNSGNITRYHKDKFDCENGQLVTKPPPSQTASPPGHVTDPTTAAITPVPNNRGFPGHVTDPTTAAIAPAPNNHGFPSHSKLFNRLSKGGDCAGQRSQGTCNGEPLCRRWKCCGDKSAYLPLYQTCCVQMAKAAVHSMHAERDHACCGIKVYTRGTQPCLHPALNDRLWNKHPALDDTHSIQLDVCKADYVYVLKQIRKLNGAGEREAILKQIVPAGNRKAIGLSLAFDKYTPRGRIGKNSIAILTKVDRSQESRFFAYANDQIFDITKSTGPQIKKFGGKYGNLPRLIRACQYMKKNDGLPPS